MAAILRTTAFTSTRAAAFRAPATVVRSFQSGRALRAGKESSLHNENRGEEAEQLKQQHLKDQKAGKNTWTEGLASDSESIVKADRGEVKADQSTIESLQKESVKAAEKERK